MDGNFSAQHQRMKKPEDDVRLADGHGYMVTDAPYKVHLRSAKTFSQACRSIMKLHGFCLRCHTETGVPRASGSAGGEVQTGTPGGDWNWSGSLYSTQFLLSTLRGRLLEGRTVSFSSPWVVLVS